MDKHRSSYELRLVMSLLTSIHTFVYTTGCSHDVLTVIPSMFNFEFFVMSFYAKLRDSMV
jgi:hypothetical protein